jgi:hypothetical protein
MTFGELIPLIVSAVPAGLFKLLRLIAIGLDKPGAEPSTSIVIAIGVVETLGIVTMAWVFLRRREFVFGQLEAATNARPSGWRKTILACSFICLIVFSTLTNVSAACSGGEFLLIASLPVFVGYFLCNRIAFAGL